LGWIGCGCVGKEDGGVVGAEFGSLFVLFVVVAVADPFGLSSSGEELSEVQTMRSPCLHYLVCVQSELLFPKLGCVIDLRLSDPPRSRYSPLSAPKFGSHDRVVESSSSKIERINGQQIHVISNHAHM
jgi:hypothetical protein